MQHQPPHKILQEALRRHIAPALTRILLVSALAFVAFVVPPADPAAATTTIATATDLGQGGRMSTRTEPYNGDAVAVGSPLRSPDRGDHCAPSLSAEDLTAFFSQPIGRMDGADYQRALRLPDDRVLWTFQDAFVGGVLVHNLAMVQSGRCFTLLNAGTRSWLLDDETTPQHRWHWILGGGVSSNGTEIHLFVAEMIEPGAHYLSQAGPIGVRRVIVDAATLRPSSVGAMVVTGDDLYGWSVTSSGAYTYLYSHCYQQFGRDTLFGFGSCAEDVKLARIPRDDFDATREYWNGGGWSADHRDATPVIDGTFVGSLNNPAQVQFDGSRFVVVEKRDDWWGRTVEIGVADRAEGPFTPIASLAEPLMCEREKCNTYFASWVPWVDPDGRTIWAISHNRWNGKETSTNLHHYRPTFHAVETGAVAPDAMTVPANAVAWVSEATSPGFGHSTVLTILSIVDQQTQHSPGQARCPSVDVRYRPVSQLVATVEGWKLNYRPVGLSTSAGGCIVLTVQPYLTYSAASRSGAPGPR